MRRFGTLLGAAALLALPLVGCTHNPQAPARVGGRITYKGSPVPAGTVMFHTPDKGIYPGPLNAEGTYEILDVPTGELVVTVETETINPKKKAPDYAGGKGAKMYAERVAAEGNTAALKAPPQQYVRIPPKYADPKQSPLRATLQAGRQSQDFTLTD